MRVYTVPHTVTAAGGESLPAFGKGTVEVMTNVWNAPKIGRNLSSVLAAQDRNPREAK